MTAKHPAKFTDAFIPVFADLLKDSENVIDIFAGTCKIAKIKEFGYAGKIYCNELEPEWAEQGLGKVDAITTEDAESLPYKDDFFDAVCTSPTYGNRMADHHNARDGSVRNTYTHKLGRKLTEGNTGKMHWGEEYREKHIKIWKETRRILKDNGVLILNISDHIRKGEVVEVSKWHKETLLSLGFELEEEKKIVTPRFRYGANSNKRVDYEYIFTFVNKKEAATNGVEWKSDWNGYEVGFEGIPVVALYGSEKLNCDFYVNAENGEILEVLPRPAV